MLRDRHGPSICASSACGMREACGLARFRRGAEAGNRVFAESRSGCGTSRNLIELSGRLALPRGAVALAPIAGNAASAPGEQRAGPMIEGELNRSRSFDVTGGAEIRGGRNSSMQGDPRIPLRAYGRGERKVLGLEIPGPSGCASCRLFQGCGGDRGLISRQAPGADGHHSACAVSARAPPRLSKSSACPRMNSRAEGIKKDRIRNDQCGENCSRPNKAAHQHRGVEHGRSTRA